MAFSNSGRIALALILATGTVGAAEAETISVGVSAGPHAEIMEVVKGIAAEDGLDIEIIEFTDYVVPNQALSYGDIEANSFQHQPYLDNQVKDRGFDLVSIAKTVVFPMGFYSQRHGSLDELPDGATVAIQNDPTNGGRALLLLESEGLIEVDDAAGLTAGVLDITENPKGLEFLELDAAQLPRAVADVDAAAVNTNYAVEAGLDPKEDAIAQESADSPYTNVIAVRAEDADAPWAKALVEAYHTDAVKAFVEERFGGAVVPGW
ncbi:MAG TPA: MetQ/NlpA family ABC transporter substrate-binding protein [Alphaproteobacteria bacterium]|nr:MetQ/NlpA family ABC transporter substrate-binding protein [Alphaproteobacteria bacterium]